MMSLDRFLCASAFETSTGRDLAVEDYRVTAVLNISIIFVWRYIAIHTVGLSVTSGWGGEGREASFTRVLLRTA